MINTWKITDKNKNIPLTNEELESILQDEQFYDLFDDENIGSVIDSNHESIDSHDSNSVTEVTDNDDISDRHDEENSDDAFLGKDKITKWMKMPPPASRRKKHNIVTHLPGRSVAKHVKDIFESDEESEEELKEDYLCDDDELDDTSDYD
ncbi:hypothetical protein FQA39_LY13793 [Lamprigera yunnana]|nr:hypothetical protein FQA39_LY13793 [Lamprigera yunnana]